MKKDNNRPPRTAEILMKILSRSENMQYLIGDLEESYQKMKAENGSGKALLWYWSQLILPLPVILRNHVKWSMIMLNNYLKIALRNMKKHKGFSAINISGLAAGMACCIVMLLWIQDEISFDRFHKNKEHIYRILTRSTENLATRPKSSARLGPALQEKFPEISAMTRLVTVSGFWPVKLENEVVMGTNIIFTDPSFFTMFTFPFIEGDPATALDNVNSVVLTASSARRFFGSDDPIGSTLNINRQDHTVTGIIDDVPHNSHMQFDCVMPVGLWERAPVIMSWEYTGFVNYIMLHPDTPAGEFNDKIAHVMDTFVPDSKTEVSLQQLEDIHLHSSGLESEEAVISDVKYVYLLGFLSFLLIIIASINFINLTTARSSQRFKEIGLRKIVGARKDNLIKQFLSESIVISCISLVIALMLSALLLPAFNVLSGKTLSMAMLLNVDIVIGLLVITTLTGVISGSYPAFFLSSLQPVQIIKGFSIKSSNRRSYLRRILVVIQFSISIFLIISTIIVYGQLRFMKNMDLGYDKENLIVIGESSNYIEDYDAVKSELLRHTGVLGMTRGVQPIWHEIRSTDDVTWPGKNSEMHVTMQRFPVDYDYIDVMRMEITSGRNFAEDFADSANFILNEEAVRRMNITSPIGAQITIDGQRGEIIGVVRDFNHGPLHHTIEPLVFILEPALAHIIRLRPENIDETLAYIGGVFTRIAPEIPYDFWFLEDKLDTFYGTEQRTGTLILYATVMAIFIACLGMFGMISYMAAIKTKEIGIRKVLGASSFNIILLMSEEFVFLVAAAAVIAYPAAWLALNNWLQNFAYRVNVGLTVFLVSGLLGLVIALITVSYRAMKAARSNPVESLRYE
ncbi:ABC transporter permease [candidate division KSB1 bacterium]